MKIGRTPKITGLIYMLQNRSKNKYVCTNYEFLWYFLRHHFGQSSDAHSTALAAQATQAIALRNLSFINIQENSMFLVCFVKHI